MCMFVKCNTFCFSKVGENGSGKSTLVKLLTGELSPQDGFRQAHRFALHLKNEHLVALIRVHVHSYKVLAVL